MKTEKKVNLKETPIIEGELYLGYKLIGNKKTQLVTEEIKLNNKKDLDAKIASVQSRMQEEQTSFYESNCTKIDHLVSEGKSLLLVSKVPQYQLRDFITEIKLNKKLKGALAYNIVEIVDNLHKEQKQHNNISLERFFINSDGELRLLSNYDADTNFSKVIKPSTMATLPQEVKLRPWRYYVDEFRTAVVLDEVINQKPNLTSSSHEYKRPKGMPFGLYKVLKNILDHETNYKFRKSKNADASYLLKSLEHYQKHSGRIKSLMAGKYKQKYMTSRS